MSTSCSSVKASDLFWLECPRREAQAHRTRERIIDAARRLWVERGFGTTTMEAIAVEANVAVQIASPRHRGISR
ncbi:MAG: helix-turn-helix domain-containing protein [Candidatus Limnocylindria bacterium]